MSATATAFPVSRTYAPAEHLQLLQVFDGWHAFAGAGRELLALWRDGQWQQLDYAFPADGQQLALHWRAGTPLRVWRVAGPGADVLRFPAVEARQLPELCRAVPADLASCLQQLAQSAVHGGVIFHQRRQEPRPERRRQPRLSSA